MLAFYDSIPHWKGKKKRGGENEQEDIAKTNDAKPN